MRNFKIIILTSLLCFQNPSQAQSRSDSMSESPTITVIAMDVSDEVLKLNYEIRNSSEQDIWLYEGLNRGYKNFEVYMTEDDETLLIRRRLAVPKNTFTPEHLSGWYRRIGKNTAREECLLLPLPVHRRTFFRGLKRRVKDLEYAKRLKLEIGFYSGDLNEIIFDFLDKAEKYPEENHINEHGYPIDIVGWLVSSLHFNTSNEGVLNRDEQVVLWWNDGTLKGEQVIVTKIDDLKVPYMESPRYLEPKPFDLTDCTKIEIIYEPSMLDHFFPYASQKRLLSETEIAYLRSQKKIVVDDLNLIRTINDAINNKAIGDAHIVTEFRTAHATCYREHERMTSFTVFDDAFIKTEDKQQLWYWSARDKPSMRMLTPQIESFELRMKCAINLVDLGHRLRLYQKAEKKRLKDSSLGDQMVYPIESKWCDLLVRAYGFIGRKQWVMRKHKCPSSREGKSHYAINPNCKPDSPGDVVLLFETEAGWNQHGGPELFTFDNHNPKGGCVLLNDGTVMFIRTDEKLRELRWK